jgi:hypothetical protein
MEAASCFETSLSAYWFTRSYNPEHQGLNIRNILNQIREIKVNFMKYKKVLTNKKKVEYIEFKVIAH